MSESANGGEVRFVRLWLPEFHSWVREFRQLDGGASAVLTHTETRAAVLVSPTREFVEKIEHRFGTVLEIETSYDQWIAAGGDDETE